MGLALSGSCSPETYLWPSREPSEVRCVSTVLMRPAEYPHRLSINVLFMDTCEVLPWESHPARTRGPECWRVGPESSLCLSSWTRLGTFQGRVEPSNLVTEVEGTIF